MSENDGLSSGTAISGTKLREIDDLSGLSDAPYYGGTFKLPEGGVKVVRADIVEHTSGRRLFSIDPKAPGLSIKEGESFTFSFDLNDHA